jgi:hypothetical protein
MLCGKGRVRTQDLGYQAERYDHCATRPVYISVYAEYNFWPCNSVYVRISQYEIFR